MIVDLRETIRFSIPGEPKGKVNMKPIRMGSHLSLCNTQHNENYMSLVRDSFYKTKAEKIPDGSLIYMEIRAYHQIPKSISKKKREKMLLAYIRPTKKPDCDNISKIICDSLNGIAFHDDSMIVGLQVEKYYSENPQVDVLIKYCKND